MKRSRARVLAVVAVAALTGALAVWVVPAFSGGTAGEWTWVSGQVVSDDESGSAALTAYNGSSQPQQLTARAVGPSGATDAPTTAATVTVAAGNTANWSWNCSGFGGCARVYEVHTQSPDVVPTLLYDEVGTAGTGPFTGLVPPGGFQVFGPDQSSTAATTQAIVSATAVLQTETAELQTKTADLQGDTTKLKADTAALQTGNVSLQTDTAQLRKDSKKLKKQLKRVLKAVR